MSLPPPLVAALGDLGFEFLISARDLTTPVTPDARAAMSGLSGVSLIRPEVLPGGLVDLDGHDRAADPRGLTARLLPADYREEPGGRRERMILQGGDHDKESRWAVRAR